VSIVEGFIDTARDWAGRILYAPTPDADTTTLTAPMLMDQFMRG
jgi:hypothetical protein